MPKIRKPTKADFSAMTSNDVTYRKVRNQTIVSTITIPKKSKSLKKKACNDRFANAHLWVDRLFFEPGMKELYSKGITENKNNARMVAVTDYMTPPKIHYISLKQHTGAIGDKIRIKATDDFQVTSVNVTITDKNGVQLETGAAIQYKRKPKMWVYELTVANPEVTGTVIEVFAMDRPENKTVEKVTVGG